jgi:DNA-binding MarR family transcriptional regulator
MLATAGTAARSGSVARRTATGPVAASASSGSARAAVDPIAEAVRQWEVHGYDAIEHMEATSALNRLSHIVVRRIDGELRRFDLTFAQYEALVLLHFSRNGALPLGRMGRRLMVHPATVTNTVDLLEEKGFVRRERDTGDRRLVLAAITVTGRDVAQKATDALVSIRYGLDDMTVAEATQLADVVRAVRSRIGDYV